MFFEWKTELICSLALRSKKWSKFFKAEVTRYVSHMESDQHVETQKEKIGTTASSTPISSTPISSTPASSGPVGLPRPPPGPPPISVAQLQQERERLRELERLSALKNTYEFEYMPIKTYVHTTTILPPGNSRKRTSFAKKLKKRFGSECNKNKRRCPGVRNSRG